MSTEMSKGEHARGNVCFSFFLLAAVCASHYQLWNLHLFVVDVIKVEIETCCRISMVLW